MEDIDLERQEPFPVDRDGKPLRSAADQLDSGRKKGFWERFQQSVSKWMLPEDFHCKYLERANCRPPPIFIILISIAELAVFIYYAMSNLSEAIRKSPLTYKPRQREEVWRFISYMFVHGSLEHIVVNMTMQLLLGIPLELVHKGFEVGMLYMAGVLAGSLSSSIFDPLTALVGASAGVYALIGCHLVNAVVNFREMIPFLGVYRILTIVIVVVVDFSYALYREFSPYEGGMKVSIEGHIGGLMAGIAIGYVLVRTRNTKRLKDPCFWLCILGYVAFVIFAVIFNIFLSPAP